MPDMHIVGALDALDDIIETHVRNGETIGFVPTMGALHEGHLSLIRKSREQNNVTVVSIFVNPLQFNNASDLEKYPRVLEEDTELLAGEMVDIVFTPLEEEFYEKKPIISIDFGSLSQKLEGEHRPGHFEGVGVVVSKFLHLVKPTRVYFGLKDLQQFILIKRMCADLSFSCDVIGVDTVREASGLALSSRNRRLSDVGKKEAVVISEGLNLIREGIKNGVELPSLVADAENLYHKNQYFDLEYLAAIDPSDFSEVDSYDKLDELAVCVAGYVEGIRLIDNLYLRLK